MLKRTIPLLFAVAVIFSVAVPAQADHCVRCSFSPTAPQFCVWGSVLGRTDCEVNDGVCETFGDPCNHQLAAVALSTEFEVASVERIDEAPAANETLVAQLDAPQLAAESTR